MHAVGRGLAPKQLSLVRQVSRNGKKGVTREVIREVMHLRVQTVNAIREMSIEQ